MRTNWPWLDGESDCSRRPASPPAQGAAHCSVTCQRPPRRVRENRSQSRRRGDRCTAYTSRGTPEQALPPVRCPFALPEPRPHLPRHQLREVHGRRVQAEPPRARGTLDAGTRRGLQRRQLPRERRLVSVEGGLGLREVRARALRLVLELRDGFVEASRLHL